MLAFWANLQAIARDDPERTALLGDNVHISYQSLSDSATAVAGSLAAMGVLRGDRVALIATKTPVSIAAILGALQLGAVIVPINPLLKSRQRAHIVRDSGAKTVFCSTSEATDLLTDKNLSALISIVVNTGLVNEVAKSRLDSLIGVDIIKWTDLLAMGRIAASECQQDISDDLGAILYTSGSTGSPKGVMLTRSNLHHGALGISTYLSNTQEDRILALMPLSFDYGLSQLTSAIHCGACLVLHDYLFPKAVIDSVLKHRITGLPAMPHLWDRLMGVRWPDTPWLRYATSTGGSLQQPTIEAIGNRLPNTALYSMYGFTEAFRATYLPPAQSLLKPASVGIAVPYAKVLVVDADGRETAPLEHGEIIQSGELVTAGYWNDPKSTSQKFRTRPAICGNIDTATYAWSGDVGYKDADGYLYFVSRNDDIIKLNGHRVSPAEIEKNLISCDLLDEVCVLCVPDLRFGNTAIAIVVAKNEVLVSDLTNWARLNLPSFMVPTEWYCLPELPTSANNKVDRSFLLSQYQNGSLVSM